MCYNITGIEKSTCEQVNESKADDENAVTNVGKAYNAHDGAFVVPVNGTYAFAVSLFSQGKKYVGVEIVVNGDVKGEVFADSQEINDVHSSSASVVVDVNVGDHVVTS
ncbi:hypothetical protein MAR_014559 [Mya arenaria]|uniref:C1q domain-containing protein n=1 Tax=Mya arenaria TaxID=6604 RepID=A0ABY7G343_MYAAR|nr:hypothetical protein MAR_014559 [Mya arenaria]